VKASPATASRIAVSIIPSGGIPAPPLDADENFARTQMDFSNDERVAVEELDRRGDKS